VAVDAVEVAVQLQAAAEKAGKNGGKFLARKAAGYCAGAVLADCMVLTPVKPLTLLPLERPGEWAAQVLRQHAGWPKHCLDSITIPWRSEQS
jgi:hypothetical protein